MACRFILGIVEAPFFAGVLFYLSKWYTKRELNLRMSIFYSASLLSGAFGPLIAAGILSGMDGVRGIYAWQWVSELLIENELGSKLTASHSCTSSKVPSPFSSGLSSWPFCPISPILGRH